LKIILSNYRFFISGGPERYLFSIKDLFEKNGIEVFPFSVRSPMNMPTKWEEYFLSPITSDDSVYFHQYRRNLKTLTKVVERSFYSPEGFFKARKYAKEVKANLIYCLHFMNKMSPSIIDGFKSVGIPVVVRLSDFGLICPQQLMFCNDNICESCVGGSILNCIRKKCVYNSYSGSFLKASAITFHKLVGSISRVDAFVCPSIFTQEKYVEAGFSEDKIHCIPPFIDTSDYEPNYSHEGYILYFGRVSEEKGVHVLLDAYELIDVEKPKLVVIGNIGKSEYSCALKKRYSECVEFLNFMPNDKLYQFLRNAMFVVVPSVCYDNMPNVVLESFAHGKPVIASKHGCFPEIIRENHTGLFFEAGNAYALAERLKWAIRYPDAMIEMGKNAREYTEQSLSPELHLSRLIKLFETFL
jgi:glycosyltransferase involved in cell wall biosynthesis